MSNLGLTLVGLGLVLVNGFFVAAEFAIVKLRQTQADELRRRHGWFGQALYSVRTHLDAYLSACQLGITLASLGLGWIGEPAFAALIGPPLAALAGASPEAIEGIAFVLAFGLLSFLHIVLGELAPKSVAIRQPVTVSLWTAAPLFLFYWVSYPFIWLLNRSAFGLLRLFGFDLAHDEDAAHSAGELKQVLAASHRHGELTPTAAAILTRTLDFPDLTVGDLMQPSARMVVLDVDAPVEETLARIARHRYSRYPVCSGEQLAGLLHVKDLFPAPGEPPRTQLRPLLRELPAVERGRPAAELFHRFRSGDPHFAVVKDRGTTVGFITLDDLLQALVGRIDDEFRRPRPRWRQRPDGSWEGRGWYSIHSLEQALGRELRTGSTDSVGGAVMERLDRVPRRGDRVELDGITVEVEEMDGARVARLRVHTRAAPEAEAAE